MNTYCQLIRITQPVEDIRIEEASELSGMHPEMIQEFLRAHLVPASMDQDGSYHMDSAAIDRLRQIERLRNRERASLRTIRYIIALLDMLEEQESQLRALRENPVARTTISI